MTDAAGRRDGVLLLVTTNRRAERFIPHVRAALDLTWPSRPRCLFVTDGDAAGADILRGSSTDFVPLALEGLELALRRYPGITHVFHMLEDHCPLRTVAAGTVDGTMDAAMRHGLAATSFVTYPWPWQEVDGRTCEDGLVRTWRRVETAVVGGRRFAVVPREFFRYFQLQPTLWRADYLAGLLRSSIGSGVTDPWGFEALRLDCAEQHYVADYAWPTVHHGFLAQGAVNHDAIRFIDGRALPSFKRHLIAEWSGSERASIYHLEVARMTARRFAERVRHRIAARFRGRLIS